MGKLIRYANANGQCWARVDLENGDPIWISVASKGTIIMVKRSRLGLFGRILYAETNPHKAAGTAMALHGQVERYATPVGMTHPVLRAFVQAAMDVKSAPELSARLNSALEGDPEAFINSAVSETRANPLHEHVCALTYTTLPQIIFADPHRVTEKLRAEKWQDVVVEAWADANRACQEKGVPPAARVTGLNGLRFQTLKESFGSIFLLIFPEPQAAPEPYAIAIVVGPYVDDPVGYFTLERMFTSGSAHSSAVVGQMTECYHFNHGTIEPASVKGFLKAVAHHASDMTAAALNRPSSQFITKAEAERLVYAFADVMADHYGWIPDAARLPDTKERLYIAFDYLIQHEESRVTEGTACAQDETLQQLKALRCRVASFQTIEHDDAELVRTINAGPNPITELAERLADGTAGPDAHAAVEMFIKYNRRAMEKSTDISLQGAA